MNQISSNLFPGQVAVLLLASAMALPAMAQQAQPSSDPQSTPPAAAQPSSSNLNTPADKEGFWGHLNPLARKKWVHKRLDPLNDRLTELDQVNAQNAKDIKDVDARAQAGIQKAQTTADTANQAALAAGTQAQNANTLAQGASGHVDKLHQTVSGLDQYHQINTVDISFRSGSPVLSKAAKEDLDDMAAKLAGHQGYILELEAHSPAAGAAGIQNSQKLASSVERYLVTEHQIPVYRMHSVALGNAAVATADDDKPARVRTSTVSIRLMENSLAAQDASSPQGMASNAGAERP
ncbi:MAG: OmpA family protein [Terracidiphilus sp.]|nr:OmpA family protein [Terracidiphilus sp.]